MNILLSILFITVLSIIYYIYYNKKKVNNKVIKYGVKMDNAPISNDVSITITSKKGIITIDKSFLKYKDEDGDIITHVKYKIDNGDIYLNENLTEIYEQWTALPINSKIYIKSKSGDVHKIIYSVKSNDKWSK